MKRSFVYLAYLVDWFICQVLGWRVSITLEVKFCIEAVKEGMPGMTNRTFSTPVKVADSHLLLLPKC